MVLLGVVGCSFSPASSGPVEERGSDDAAAASDLPNESDAAADPAANLELADIDAGDEEAGLADAASLDAASSAPDARASDADSGAYDAAPDALSVQDAQSSADAASTCAVGQQLPGERCVPCDASAGTGATCAPLRCAENLHVVQHKCEPCAAGSTRPAGDDPAGADTACASILCERDQRVLDHRCVACGPALGNAPGDDAAGADTTCEVVRCGLNQRVQSHVCVACPSSALHPPGDLVSGPDTSCSAGANNLAFVSPVAVTGDLGGLAGADALCANWASAAGHPGTYRAILSSSAQDAAGRLAGARGWVRSDGRPLADQPSELFASHGPLAPLRLDAAGNDVGSALVWSGSNSTGSYTATTGDCQGWTSDSSMYLARVGLSDATNTWLSRSSWDQCSSAHRIYCFQVDHAAPLRVSDYAEEGRRMFVSKSSFSADGGLLGADALCNSDAAAAGLGGTYAALLAGDGTSAIGRFSDDARPLVRPDGLRVANSLAALGTSDLLHPPALDPTGTFTQGTPFTGGALPSGASTSNATCANWSSNLALRTAACGSPYATARQVSVQFWFTGANDTCASANPVYCLQK